MHLGIFEKRSLIAIGVALLLFLAAIFEIGKRNLWFEPKIQYTTRVTDADGLRVGGYVTISGLRVGDIAALEVNEENQITVTINVKKSIANKVTEGSYVTIFRAFVIGEKRIELVPGTPANKPLAAGTLLDNHATTELTDFITGKKLTEIVTNVETLISGLTAITKNVDTIFGKYHDGEFNKAISLVEPSLENFIKLSNDLIVISRELKKQNKVIPEFVTSGTNVFKSMHEDFFKDRLMRETFMTVNQTLKPIASRQEVVGDLLNTLSDLAGQLKQNPDYAAKIIEAVSELTITMKALQKTWLLEDQTKEVKKGN